MLHVEFLPSAPDSTDYDMTKLFHSQTAGKSSHDIFGKDLSAQYFVDRWIHSLHVSSTPAGPSGILLRRPEAAIIFSCAQKNKVSEHGLSFQTGKFRKSETKEGWYVCGDPEGVLRKQSQGSAPLVAAGALH
jgi:hypothetical protein